jgi:hypothetical protein
MGEAIITILFANNASSTIAAGITPTSTTILLASGSGIEFPVIINAGDYFCATLYDAQTKHLSEIIHVTARSGDTLTVARGQENTIARGWAPGDLIINGLTAGSLANFVQSGGPPQSSTSIIYVGTDTSSAINLINCVTNPVPASLVAGMQFNIKVANTNNGPVTAQLNGLAAIPVVRQDGSAMVGKELTIAQEMIFVYNGTALEAMYPGVTGVVLPPASPTAPPTPAAPQYTILYVDPSGYDSWDGLSNVAQYGWVSGPGPNPGYNLIHGPCASVQGAMDKFLTGKYPPVADVWIHVAPGTYFGGFADSSGGVVGMWHVIGAPLHPVIIGHVYPPTGGTVFPDGLCCSAGGTAHFDVQNMQFQSLLNNIQATDRAIISATNCDYTNPNQAIESCVEADKFGKIYLYGNNTLTIIDPTIGFAGLLSASNGGQIIIGSPGTLVNFNFIGIINGNYIIQSTTNGLVTFATADVVFTGQYAEASSYLCETGGGLALLGAIIPATGAPVVNIPGWVTK